jgi:hypothetical protein
MQERAPVGRLCGRFFKALAVAKGDLSLAAQYASHSRWV